CLTLGGCGVGVGGVQPAAPPPAGSRADAVNLRIRRAGEEDVDFLVELVNEDSIEPFLAASRARDREGVLEEVQGSQEAPEESGVFVIEVADDDEWARAGMMTFSPVNQRSPIDHLW